MTPKQMAQIKLKYYENIRNRVELLTGQSRGHLKTYQKHYEEELKSLKWVGASLKDFEKQLSSKQLIFIGDFHAHSQSTRTLLRIARHLKNKKIVIGLECFLTDYQFELDQYIQGNLSEKEFLKKIEWQRHWGFPFDFVRPLMKYAIQNQIKVLALNSLKTKNLTERDGISAEIILNFLKINSDSQILIQYGDFHLAKDHLLKKIISRNKKLTTITLFQSPESLYFKFALKGVDPLKYDFYKANEKQWAVMSLLPWVKWQDYLLFLEGGFDKKVKVEDVDFSDYVSENVNLLSQIYDLKVNLDELSVYTINDEILFEKLRTLPLVQRKFYEDQVVNQQSFFCPELASGFLAKPTVNHITRVASLYILYKLKVFTTSPVEAEKSFYKMIWIEMLNYFFSKSLNPKKKTDSFDDIRMALKNQNFSDKGREALTLALEQKLNEIRQSALHQVSSGVNRKLKHMPLKVTLTAAQILGNILGEKLFLAEQKKKISFKKQKTFFLKDPDHKLFQKAYFESVEVIDSWFEGISSKYKQF